VIPVAVALITGLLLNRYLPGERQRMPQTKDNAVHSRRHRRPPFGGNCGGPLSALAMRGAAEPRP
jgi:hypothetical protein